MLTLTQIPPPPETVVHFSPLCIWNKVVACSICFTFFHCAFVEPAWLWESLRYKVEKGLRAVHYAFETVVALVWLFSTVHLKQWGLGLSFHPSFPLKWICFPAAPPKHNPAHITVQNTLKFNTIQRQNTTHCTLKLHCVQC